MEIRIFRLMDVDVRSYTPCIRLNEVYDVLTDFTWFNTTLTHDGFKFNAHDKESFKKLLTSYSEFTEENNSETLHQIILENLDSRALWDNDISGNTVDKMVIYLDDEFVFET